MEKVFKANIYGVELMFTTDESDENTERTVEEVRERIKNKMENSSSVNVAKASIFACLDLCDELTKAKEEIDRLSKEVLISGKNEQQAQQDRKDALDQVERLRSEVLDLKIRLSNEK